MRVNWIRQLLILQVSSASLLWAFLLPPWEGFDEAQHFSYVRTLSSDSGFPRLGATPITEDVWKSLIKTPVSLSTQQNYPMLTSFDEARLGLVRNASKYATPHNYEAHQAPLAYILMAPFDLFLQKTMLDGGKIEIRLRIIRVVLLIATSSLLWLAAIRLIADRLHRYCALFLIFTTEMFYGACGHVANDWLAISLFVFLFAELVVPSWRTGLVFSLGLLTKSYFLAFTPLFVFAMRWRSVPWLLIAAPWYIRNLLLYRNVSGMQEQAEGISVVQMMSAASQLPWLESFGVTYRDALWLANSSFLEWSKGQITVVCVLIVVGAIWSLREKPYRLKLVAFLLSFILAIAYAALQSFIYTKGAAVAASSWYATPVWLLLLLMLNDGMLDRSVRGAMVIVWAYWFSATLWVKLLPWYGGVLTGPSSLKNVFSWYSESFYVLVSGVGGWSVVGCAIVTTVTTLALAGALVLQLVVSREGSV